MKPREKISRLSDLTLEEGKIIKLSAGGQTVKQIAALTGYSVSRINDFFDRDHKDCFYHRIAGVDNRSQLIAWYEAMKVAEALLTLVWDDPPTLEQERLTGAAWSVRQRLHKEIVMLSRYLDDNPNEYPQQLIMERLARVLPVYGFAMLDTAVPSETIKQLAPIIARLTEIAVRLNDTKVKPLAIFSHRR